jgi:hypothetical protein
MSIGTRIDVWQYHGVITQNILGNSMSNQPTPTPVNSFPPSGDHDREKNALSRTGDRASTEGQSRGLGAVASEDQLPRLTTNALREEPPVYERFDYAFNETLKNLQAVLRSNNDYVILLAFSLAVVGFGGMQIAINHDTGDVFTPIILGFAATTVLFLATIGFIAVICTLFVFSYSLSIGRDRGSSLSASSRGWRLVLSFVVSGVLTAAVFNLFWDGIRDIPYVETQYPLLDSGN